MGEKIDKTKNGLEKGAQILGLIAAVLGVIGGTKK